MAGQLKEACASLGIPLIYKGSFDKANRSSGTSKRGVGMDAVRGFVEAEGGTLDLVVRGDGSGTEEYVEFETVITLPRALAEHVPA